MLCWIMTFLLVSASLLNGTHSFILDRELGMFACQSNPNIESLTLYNISAICDGVPHCYNAFDEDRHKLECKDDCYPACVHGTCLKGSQCYCDCDWGGKSCNIPDVNECKNSPCHNMAFCTNTLGSFYCTCLPGFRGNGFECQDIDECLNPQETAPHFDMEGAGFGDFSHPYYSALLRGRNMFFPTTSHLQKQLSQSLLATYQRKRHANISNIFNSTRHEYTDIGDLGQNSTKSHRRRNVNYLVNTNSIIDEGERVAVRASKACASNAKCYNVPGSYYCECENGFSGDGYLSCKDVDECTDANICNTFKYAQCLNSIGSYTCQCYKGFELLNGVCHDIDECQHQSKQMCHQNAYCVNKIGGHECRCNTGFIGSGEFCNDLDECADPALNKCPNLSTCINNIGSYECRCQSGYQMLNGVCTDINECESNDFGINHLYKNKNDDKLCGPNAVCLNTPGSYKCQCKDGYVGNGSDCQDVNECQNPLHFKCGIDALCQNTQGSYICKCPQNKSGNPYVRCENINECQPSNEIEFHGWDTTLNCNLNARCLFNQEENRYKCVCNPGFMRNGTDCQDINECVENTELCKPGKCVNSIGAYFCQDNHFENIIEQPSMRSTIHNETNMSSNEKLSSYFTNINPNASDWTPPSMPNGLARKMPKKYEYNLQNLHNYDPSREYTKFNININRLQKKYFDESQPKEQNEWNERMKANQKNLIGKSRSIDINPNEFIQINCKADGIDIGFNFNVKSADNFQSTISPTRPNSFNFHNSENQQSNNNYNNNNTQRPFNGVVYVRGNFNVKQCRKAIMNNDRLDFQTNFYVKYGDCAFDINMDKGEYSTIIVVQPHLTLLTFDAKAYKIYCYYQESERVISNELNVSMIVPNQVLKANGTPPPCKMAVLDSNGQPITTTDLGTKLQLKISLDYAATDKRGGNGERAPTDFTFGMMARNCVAKTITEEWEYQLVDERGCSTDLKLFQNFQANPEDGSIFATFSAFKFPSSIYMRFKCDVKICMGPCEKVDCQNESLSLNRNEVRRFRRSILAPSQKKLDENGNAHRDSLVEEVESKLMKIIEPSNVPFNIDQLMDGYETRDDWEDTDNVQMSMEDFAHDTIEVLENTHVNATNKTHTAPPRIYKKITQYITHIPDSSTIAILNKTHPYKNQTSHHTYYNEYDSGEAIDLPDIPELKCISKSGLATGLFLTLILTIVGASVLAISVKRHQALLIQDTMIQTKFNDSPNTSPSNDIQHLYFNDRDSISHYQSKAQNYINPSIHGKCDRDRDMKIPSDSRCMKAAETQKNQSIYSSKISDPIPNPVTTIKTKRFKSEL